MSPWGLSRCFVTDDDTALENVLTECSLFSSPCVHVLCGRHLRKNCERKLTGFRVDEKTKQEILVQIFGREIQISKEFGRKRQGGLVDCNVDEYDIAVRRTVPNWPDEFAKYFMQHKYAKIRDHYNSCVRPCSLVALSPWAYARNFFSAQCVPYVYVYTRSHLCRFSLPIWTVQYGTIRRSFSFKSDVHQEGTTRKIPSAHLVGKLSRWKDKLDFLLRAISTSPTKKNGRTRTNRLSNLLKADWVREHS